MKNARILAILALVLGGCAFIDEETQYHIKKDWENFRAIEWRQTLEKVSGAHELVPSPRAKKEYAEQQICLHRNGENRVISQNGVSDEVAYRRCVLTPYPVGAKAPGQRLGNRPEPQT